ncbi:hypothetical protein HOC35_07290 [Candidatus Woesearchaeota archaeon]|jgi:hypothetical protein|nr:hypothetical protein [Candidatus Woesearchaeota archaeon]
MGTKNHIQWEQSRGNAPLKAYQGGNRIAGAEMIVKTFNGWHRSNDLGTRTFSNKGQPEVIQTAGGYNTLSHDNATFLDDLINRDTIDNIGTVEMSKNQNAGFFVGYFHEKEKNVGIIARYVEVQHASGSLFGYGFPEVVEGDDISKAYSLTKLPKELHGLRSQKIVANKYGVRVFESMDDLRMTSELYTMYACFLDYGISPEILLDISSFLMPITTAFVVMKAVMTISSYNGVIKEKFSDKIKLKEQELAEARKIKMISGERALDNLHKLYDK